MSTAPERVVVIGVGNALGGDDAAGLLVARRVRERIAGIDVVEHEGDSTGLVELLDGAGGAVIVDALRSGSPPGTVRRFDAGAAPLPVRLRGSTSTHAVGLADAIELARTLGRLPARLVVIGIEGERFTAGAAHTPAVEGGIAAATAAVLAELTALRQ